MNEQDPQTKPPLGNQTPQEPRKIALKKRELIIFLAALLVLGVAAVVVILVRHQKDKDSPLSSNNTSKSVSDLLTSTNLECVPRGHDYYRTNNTFAIDPKNPETLYVGVEYKGVYKSTDGGATWQQSDKGVRGYAKEADNKQKCIQELGRIVIDPQDSKHLLLSRIESPSTLKMIFGETAGLYESRDGGAHWHQIISDNMNASGSRGIAFDPKDSQTIYYGVNNMKPSFKVNGKQSDKLFNGKGILYKTTNGGKDWTELATGAEEGLRTMGVFVDNTNSQNIWLGTFDQEPKGGTKPTQKGMLKTTDGGKTWKSFPQKLAMADVAVSPTKFNHVYTPLQTTSGPPEAYYSVDGNTFQKADSNVYAMVGRYDPHDSTGLRMLGYAPYNDPPGLYESKDGGKSWTQYAELPKEVTAKKRDEFGSISISEIVWHPTDKNIVYMTGSAGTAWKSTDGGKTWKSILTLDTIGGLNKNKDGAEKSREPDQ